MCQIPGTRTSPRAPKTLLQIGGRPGLDGWEVGVESTGRAAEASVGKEVALGMGVGVLSPGRYSGAPTSTGRLVSRVPLPPVAQ